MIDKIKYVKDLLSTSKNIVFMTGAGVSTHSGIPDYRSLNGLYSDNPEYMLSEDCWENEYDKFMDFIKNKFLNILDVEPNDIHKWIASFDNATVITQNIDFLHQKAGSKNVITYHGNINKWICTGCELDFNLKSIDISTRCVCCNEKLKPDVVLYGQNIDSKNDSLAISAIEEADLIIVIGTSLKVFPFAGLLDFASLDKSKIILINNEVTENYSKVYDVMFIGDALKTIKELQEE